METELQSELFQPVQAAVITFAKAGPLEWRKVGGKPAGDVDLLLSLPSVQEQLAGFEGDLAADANAAADAIEAAIRHAIGLLPSPYQEAAREQFGFGERELDGTIPKPKDRQERAARMLGRTTQRWYTQPNREYAGLKPSEYVAALVACVLCGISDPTAHVEELASPPPKPDEPAGRVRARRSVAVAVGGLLACAVAVVVALGAFAGGGSPGPQTARQQPASNLSHSRQATPVPLLNPDVPCASLLGVDDQEHAPSTEYVDSPGQLAGGQGLEGRTMPNGKYSRLLEVKRGEVIKVSVALHNTEYTSVSDVVVRVSVVWERPRCARLTALARSTSAPGDRVELGPLRFKSASDTLPRYKYLPGSTFLFAGGGQQLTQLAHLPDGVTEVAGVAIPYQIPAGSTDYFVDFEIKVE